MSVTVPQLAARTLRRLGLSLVAQSDRAALGPTSTASDVAAMVLRDRGVPVAETDRPIALPSVTQAQVGASAWRLLGIGQRSPIEQAAYAVADQGDIVARALRLVGANPAGTTGVTTGQIYSLNDAALAALRKLDVISSDGTPSGADLAEATRAATDVHEALVADGIAYWSPTAIPAAAFEDFVVLSANRLASFFGRPTSPEIYDAAMAMLRTHALSGSMAAGRAQAALLAVQGDLAGRGYVDWTEISIPTAVVESYATLIADRMAPAFDKPRNAEQAAMAEMQIRHYAIAGSLGVTIAAERVGQVHDHLNAQGIVSWPVTAVPAAHANDYAILASILLAPFAGIQRDAQGRQVDQAAWDASITHIKRAAMIAGMQARALAKVQAVHNEMLAMGLVSWTLDAIPASMTDAYAEAATALMGAESGELDPKAQQAAYSRIRMVAMNGPAGQALAEEKVRETHFDWASRGKVQWTLLTIPRYAERLYVDKAASLLAPEMAAANALAPEVNVGMFMQLAVAAERSLAQITMVPSDGRPVMGSYF